MEIMTKIQESFHAFITSNGSVSFKTFTDHFTIFAAQLRRIQRPKESLAAKGPQNLPSATINPVQVNKYLSQGVIPSKTLEDPQTARDRGLGNTTSHKLGQKSLPRDSFADHSVHESGSRVADPKPQTPNHFDVGPRKDTEESQAIEFNFGDSAARRPQALAFNPDQDFFGNTNHISHIKSEQTSRSNDISQSVSHMNRDFFQNQFEQQEPPKPAENHFWDDWSTLPKQTPQPEAENQDPFKKKHEKAELKAPPVAMFFDEPMKDPIRSSIVKSSKDALDSIIKQRNKTPHDSLIEHSPQTDSHFQFEFKDSEAKPSPPQIQKESPKTDSNPDPVPLRNIISNPIPENNFFNSQVETRPPAPVSHAPQTEDKMLSARNSVLSQPEPPRPEENPAVVPGEIIFSQLHEWHRASLAKHCKHAAVQTPPPPVAAVAETSKPDLPPDLREKMLSLERENVRLRETNRILTTQLTSSTKANQRVQPSHSPQPSISGPKKPDPLLSLEKREKEMYKQKYNELYEKYRREKEEEKFSSQLYDPATYLEMSKINEDLLREKRLLASRLEEEVQKSKMVEFYKSELFKAKEEVVRLTKEFNRQLVQLSRLSALADDSVTKSPKAADDRSRVAREGTVAPDNVSQDRNTIKYGAYSTSMRVPNDKLADMLSSSFGPNKTSLLMDKDKPADSSSEEAEEKRLHHSKPKSTQPTQKLKQFFGKGPGQASRSPHSESVNQDLNYSVGFLDNCGKSPAEEAKFVSDSRLKPRPAASVVETKQQSFNLYKNNASFAGRSQNNEDKSERSISSAMNLYSKNKQSVMKTGRSALDRGSILSVSQTTSKEHAGQQRHKDAVARLLSNKAGLFEKK